MYCLNCGKALPANSHFCPACGTRQDADAAAPPAASAGPAPVSAATIEAPAPAVNAAAPAAALPAVAPPRGILANKTALVGGFVALALLVAGGAGYLGWQDRQASEAAAQQAASAESERKLAEESQRRVAAERAAAAAETAAARAALDRHIATLEAQVGARR